MVIFDFGQALREGPRIFPLTRNHYFSCLVNKPPFIIVILDLYQALRKEDLKIPGIIPFAWNNQSSCLVNETIFTIVSFDTNQAIRERPYIFPLTRNHQLSSPVDKAPSFIVI